MRRPILSSDQPGDRSFHSTTDLPGNHQQDRSVTAHQVTAMDTVPSQSPLPSTDSRGRTTSSSYSTARQPINEAVSSAFNATTTTESSISADLIDQITQQITQNVIQQLSVHPVHVPAAQQSVVPPGTDQAGYISTLDSSQKDRGRLDTSPSRQEDNSQSASIRSPKRTPTSIYVGSHADQTTEKNQEASPLIHGSDTSRPGDDLDKHDLPRRPNMSRRMTTDSDATVLEKCWGKFFDKDGESTSRLNQFLRGIALHVIEDYEPKNSLIITPTKMQQYYTETQIQMSEERYPWREIFDDNTSKISRLFREFGIEHHLIQRPGKVHERPDMPGLTPDGFATWMTLLIRAHPNEEFERLTTTVREMPINNPDDKTERYPKSLPRKLLPPRGDLALHERLCDRINEYCNVELKVDQSSVPDGESNYQPPTVTDELEEIAPSSSPVTSPTMQASADAVPTFGTTVHPPPPAPSTRQHERRRSVFSKTPSVTSTEEDTTDTPTPQPDRKAHQNPLERERQPYVSSATGRRSLDAGSTESGDRSDPPVAPFVERESGRERRRKSISERLERQERSRPYVHQQDLGRSRDSTAESISMHRTRSNSSYEPEIPVVARRTRTNSVYDNGEKHYRHNRSPSQHCDLPRRSDGHLLSHAMGGYSQSYYPPPPERPDHRNPVDYPPRYERPRDGVGDTRPYHLEEYYRDGATPNVGYSSKDSYAQYPPSAYRETR